MSTREDRDDDRHAPCIQRDFFVVAAVSLRTPIDQDGGGPLTGYYRQIAIRTADTQLRDLLQDAVPDGTIDWDDTTIDEITDETVDVALRKHMRSDREGIWYMSGRALYES